MGRLTYTDLCYEAIPLLTPIMKAAFDEDTRLHTNKAEDGPTGYDTGELLEKLLVLPQSVSKVIYYEGQIIGEYTIVYNDNVFTLEMFFIDPNYHSKGIGTMVWNEIETTYEDVKTWVLETPDYSTRNHHFYEKCGFKKVKECVYSADAKSFLFEKNIEERKLYVLRNHTITEDEKKEICAWQYEGEYAIYNLPPYDVMKEKNIGFLNPKKEMNFQVFYDGNVLVGFVNLLEEENAVFVGIGVNPKFCDRHYGQTILNETYRISKEKYPHKPLYLEVRTWNKRAIHAYEKAGFKVDGEAFEQKTGIGIGTFYRMMKE